MNRRSRKMRKWRRINLAKERETDGGGVEKAGRVENGEGRVKVIVRGAKRIRRKKMRSRYEEKNNEEKKQEKEIVEGKDLLKKGVK